MQTIETRAGPRSAATAGTAPDPRALYEHDLFAWANTQAALLRAGRLRQADIEHIAEEIEDLGKSELPEETFAPVCPYSIEQVLDDRWLPGDG